MKRLRKENGEEDNAPEPLTETQKLEKEVGRLEGVLAMAELRESYLF